MANKSFKEAYVESYGNGTIRFVYLMENPSNGTQVRNEATEVLVAYRNMANYYIEGHPRASKEWVPKRLNVEAVEPEEREMYYKGHTNFTVMNEYRTGEREFPGYFIPFTNTWEYGPGEERYDD